MISRSVEVNVSAAPSSTSRSSDLHVLAHKWQCRIYSLSLT